MEVSRILRHRYVICWYVVGICVAAFVHAMLFPSGKAGMILPILGISLFAFMTVLVFYMKLWVWLLGAKDQVTVWMSPGLLLAACVAHPLAHVLHTVAQLPEHLTITSWAKAAWIYAVAELVAAVALRTLVPRAQRSVQAGHDALAELSAAAGGPAVILGKLRIPAADILRVEANGNSVQIVTKQKRHIVSGPFAAVLAELPQGSGFRVHRSHWVATAGIREVERSERGLRIVTVQGDTVPVAQPVSPEVAAWLQRLPGAGAVDGLNASLTSGPLGLATLLT
jgi:DNA-binding LytR/AlgR family response regulator